MDKALVSDTQHKLALLLIKSKELVPFASDAECEAIFQKLVIFAQSLLAERDRLLSLANGKMNFDRLVESGTVNAWKEIPSRSFVSKLSYDRTDAEPGSKIASKAPTSAKANFASKLLTPAKAKPVKRERNGNLDSGLQQKKEKRSIPIDESISWNVHLNPNITEIVAVEAHPLKIIVLARPSGQGKHTPVACYATEEVLIDLDTLEKQDKTEQQRRRRILGKMKKALIKYTASNALPSEAKSCLEKTGWGMEIIEKLRFDE